VITSSVKSSHDTDYVEDGTYLEAVAVWEAEVDASGRDENGGWTMEEGLQRHGEGDCGPGGKD